MVVDARPELVDIAHRLVGSGARHMPADDVAVIIFADQLAVRPVVDEIGRVVLVEAHQRVVFERARRAGRDQQILRAVGVRS